MRKTRFRKYLCILVNIMMYCVLLIQMLYVFTGNTLHEITGVLFFICLAVHIFLKRKRIGSILRYSRGPAKKKKKDVMFSELVIFLLTACLITMMLSSMGVSRFLFPWFHVLGSSTFHRILASIILMLSVIHGCMYVYLRTARKKLCILVMILLGGFSLVLGLWAVPYINRHYRRVEIDHMAAISGEKVSWPGEKPLVVYFTRTGNTDFEEDVDVVSGASLLMASGEMMGNISGKTSLILCPHSTTVIVSGSVIVSARFSAIMPGSAKR